MFSLAGGFSLAPPSVTLHNRQGRSSQIFHFPSKTHQFHLFFISYLPNHHVSFRTGFRVFPLRSGKGAQKSFLGIEGGDEEDEIDYEFDDGDDDVAHQDEEEDDDDEFVPLRSMKKWFAKKPSGFGEGKEYDTRIEDKLLDEMKQSREAQLANINRLKNSPKIVPKSRNKINREYKASEVVPSGIRVLLFNLPKKKNIDRDLQRAFKDVPGIVNIIPAVSGNKKTRDPICKGFAFVDLKSMEYAHRFAQTVSGQSISFGKIQKPVRCEVMHSDAQNSILQQSIDDDVGTVDSSSVSWDSVSVEESEDANGNSGINKSVIINEAEPGLKSLKKKKDKKQEVKQKRPKVPKLSFPGSSKRLKVKEKAVLAGVLSKYAA